MKNTIFNGTHKTNAIILIKRKTSRAQEFVAGIQINKSLEESDQKEMTNKELSKWKKFSLVKII